MEAALDQRLVRIVPSERQLRHQELEFTLLSIHGKHLTGREWGDGTESPSIFRPESLTPINGPRRSAKRE
mgnify:CR=1 FL=1